MSTGTEKPRVGRARDRSGGRSASRSAFSEQGLRLALAALSLGPVVVLLLIVAVMAVLSPSFLTQQNLTNLFAATSITMMVALGQLLVLLVGGIDLSVGSQVAMANVVGAVLFTKLGMPGFLVIVCMLAVTGAIGLLNASIWLFGRIPHPFLVTLGTLSIFQGLAYPIANGTTIVGAPELINTLGFAQVGPIPVPAIVATVSAVVLTVLLQKTRWGRWVYAIGGNPEAARRSAIPVTAVLISTYVLCGVLTGMGAVLIYGLTGVGDPNAGGTTILLDAIAGVVIGGAGFLGGRGHVGNVIVGAMTIGVIHNGMNLLNVNSYYQFVVLGVVVILAVLLDTQRADLAGRLRVARSTSSAHDHGLEAVA